jgi:ectoine hydroxylase-related dioxygenase (phytanoyl-CoA dioxygenase family)
VEARYYTDLFVPKLPTSKKSRHGGNGPTEFHQDFITFAVDRSGGMTFWFPLEPYGPEAGTMSFVNGSHRAGVLGDYTTYGGGDALEVFPELRSLDISEPITYEIGDITVHTHLTVHGAGPNLMDRPRWAYILVTQPGDVCWNGSPCPNFDWTIMKPWEPLGGERFPVIS